MGEWMYRFIFSWPRHWLEVSGQLHAPAALPPGKEPRVPTGYEVGWTPEPGWKTWRRENSWPYRVPNSDPSVVQPVASRYTDRATSTLQLRGKRRKQGVLQKLLRKPTLLLDYMSKLKGNLNSMVSKTSNLRAIHIPWDSIKTTYVFLEELSNYEPSKDSSPET
jgi:hypothetical protein